MRVLSLEHHGSIPFPKQISLNFQNLPDVISVAGLVGSGKTTLLDLICSALYLVTPYRQKPLYRGYVESGTTQVAWAHRGKEYLSVLTVEPKARKVEALLYPGGGDPVGPHQKDYLRAVEAILGPLDLFLATSYSVQPKATGYSPVSFMAVARQERRSMLATMLGLERYEHWKAAADSAMAEAEKWVEAARARRDVYRQQGAGSEALRTAIAAAEERVAATNDAVSWAALAVEEVQQKIASQRAEGEALARLATAKQQAEKRRDETLVRLTTVKTPLPDLGVTEQDVADAEAAVVACETEITALERQLEVAREALSTKLAAAEAEVARLDQELGQVRERETALKEHKADLSGKQALLKELPILEQVPCKGEGIYANCGFLTRAVDIRLRQADLETEIAHLQQAIADGAQIGPQRTALETELVGLKKLATGLRTTSAEEQALKKQIEQVKRNRATATTTAGRRTALVERRLQEQHRRQELDRLTGEHATVESELAELETAHHDIVTRMTPDLAAQAQEAANRLQTSRADEAAAIELLAKATERLEAANRALEAAVTAESEVERETHEMRDWSIASKGLSLVGIPGLKVETALPIISAMATERLRECFGEGRWEIELISEKPSADQKRLLETLDVIIRRGGREVDASDLSGGEGVLVSEAVSIALSMYRGQRDGFWEPGLLMRDETSSALGALAPAYVEMLRNVIRQGGATQVLFVTHQQDAREHADACLEVANGTVQVR